MLKTKKNIALISVSSLLAALSIATLVHSLVKPDNVIKREIKWIIAGALASLAIICICILLCTKSKNRNVSHDEKDNLVTDQHKNNTKDKNLDKPKQINNLKNIMEEAIEANKPVVEETGIGNLKSIVSEMIETDDKQKRPVVLPVVDSNAIPLGAMYRTAKSKIAGMLNPSETRNSEESIEENNGKQKIFGVELNPLVTDTAENALNAGESFVNQQLKKATDAGIAAYNRGAMETAKTVAQTTLSYLPSSETVVSTYNTALSSIKTAGSTALGAVTSAVGSAASAFYNKLPSLPSLRFSGQSTLTPISESIIRETDKQLNEHGEIIDRSNENTTIDSLNQNTEQTEKTREDAIINSLNSQQESLKEAVNEEMEDETPTSYLGSVYTSLRNGVSNTLSTMSSTVTSYMPFTYGTSAHSLNLAKQDAPTKSAEENEYIDETAENLDTTIAQENATEEMEQESNLEVPAKSTKPSIVEPTYPLYVTDIFIQNAFDRLYSDYNDPNLDEIDTVIATQNTVEQNEEEEVENLTIKTPNQEQETIVEEESPELNNVDIAETAISQSDENNIENANNIVELTIQKALEKYKKEKTVQIDTNGNEIFYGHIDKKSKNNDGQLVKLYYVLVFCTALQSEVQKKYDEIKQKIGARNIDEMKNQINDSDNLQEIKEFTNIVNSQPAQQGWLGWGKGLVAGAATRMAETISNQTGQKEQKSDENQPKQYLMTFVSTEPLNTELKSETNQSGVAFTDEKGNEIITRQKASNNKDNTLRFTLPSGNKLEKQFSPHNLIFEQGREINFAELTNKK